MSGTPPPVKTPRNHHTLHGRTHHHPVVHGRVETTRTSGMGHLQRNIRCGLRGARATTGVSGRDDRLRLSFRAGQARRRHYTRQPECGESHTYKTQRSGQGPGLPRHSVPQLHHETRDDPMDTRAPQSRTSHHVKRLPGHTGEQPFRRPRQYGRQPAHGYPTTTTP